MSLRDESERIMGCIARTTGTVTLVHPGCVLDHPRSKALSHHDHSLVGGLCHRAFSEEPHS
eukprot:3263600-Rhodomonas_salina.2